MLKRLCPRLRTSPYQCSLNVGSIAVSTSSIGHFQVPVVLAGFCHRGLPQSMVAIAVGYAAIDKKSWTRESQQFTLEE